MSEQMNKRTEIAVRRILQTLIWVARSDMRRALWAPWGAIQTVSVAPGRLDLILSRGLHLLNYSVVFEGTVVPGHSFSSLAEPLGITFHQRS